MKGKCEAIVLLGYRLNDDGTAREEMLDRCRVAARAWKDGVSPLIIPCGGPTGRSGRTEAEVMKEALVDLGVAAEAVELEDRSMITSENIRNAREILGPGKKTLALVTSDYHMFRSALLCRRAGFRVRKFPTPTPGGQARADKRKLEAVFTFNMLMGWENPEKKRPAWADQLMRRVAMPIMNRVRNREEQPD